MEKRSSFLAGSGRAWRLVGLLLAVVVFAVVVFATPGYAGLRPAQAQTPTPEPDEGGDTPRTLAVQGSGTVEMAPDRALVMLGVVNEAEMATEAMSQTNEAMQDVVDALVEAGVAEDDIQTQAIQLEPVYEQPQQGDFGTRELIGFRASNIVEVTLMSIAEVGDVLDAAVTAGANQIQNIQFEISDPDDALEQARQEAWADAEAKAEQLADLADAELGFVVTINESTQGPIPLGRGGAAFEQAADMGTVVQPGQQTVRVDLFITWSLE